MPEFHGSNPRLPSGAIVPLSAAVRAGDFLFLSGQLGFDDDWRLVPGGLKAQTRASLARICSTLESCGASVAQVVKATVWLRRAEDFPAFNAIYAELFGNAPPARSALVSELMVPGALVEIEVTAYLGEP